VAEEHELADLEVRGGQHLAVVEFGIPLLSLLEVGDELSTEVGEFLEAIQDGSFGPGQSVRRVA